MFLKIIKKWFFVYDATRAENFRMRYPYSLDYLIRVSNGHTIDFLLKPFFLEYRRKESKTGFLR